eukprot:CAMPEP_0172437586 /NCGR_PEP_ID=MMETSP1064-20121228/72291_1 /TAXON_ID=202472 /ORGANISM="Aulacoseira subarctica , Strain CCAP 1002/5" /LENGTH=590 /DNA_ID=CAMNT_0013186069 /DNA_START=295 /DNA_END=2066 /DNA_ORIENTATION=+
MSSFQGGSGGEKNNGKGNTNIDKSKGQDEKDDDDDDSNRPRRLQPIVTPNNRITEFWSSDDPENINNENNRIREESIPALVPFSPDPSHLSSVLSRKPPSSPTTATTLLMKNSQDKPPLALLEERRNVVEILRERENEEHRKKIPSEKNSQDKPPLALLTHQMQLLSGAFGLSVVLFLLLLLPSLWACFAFLLCSTTAVLFFQTLYQYGQNELSNILDQGVLNYLPSTLQAYFTTTSINEYMQDGTFMREHYYWLLYFLPGLTPAQQNFFIQQLPQSRRDLLFHRGFLSLVVPSTANEWLLGRRHMQHPPTISRQETSEINNTSNSLLLPDPDTVENNRFIIDADVIRSETQEGSSVTHMDALRAIFNSFVSLTLSLTGLGTSATVDAASVDESNLLFLNEASRNRGRDQQQPPPDLVWTPLEESDEEDEEDLLNASLHEETQQRIVTPTIANDAPNGEEDCVRDEEIVNSAISAAMSNVAASFTAIVSSQIVSTLDQWIPTVTRTGIISSVALFGYVYVRPWLLLRANNYLPRLSTTTRAATTSNGAVVWTISLFSAAMIGTAGSLMFMRSSARAALQEAQEAKGMIPK